jgi:hypothetical protein
MRGQKIARPIRVRAPSTTAKACSMVMSSGSSAVRSVCEHGRADADHHRDHQHLDAGRDHIAQHAFGQERRLLPEREGHQHKARQRRDLELDNQHEELDREDEERRDDDDAAKAEQDDLSKVAEELERTRRNRPDMVEDRLRGCETLGGNEAGLQEIGRGEVEAER